MKSERISLKLSDDLLMSLDVFDFEDGKPFVALAFMATGSRATMPSFSVGLPLDKWAEFQALISAYTPVLKATKQ